MLLSAFLQLPGNGLAVLIGERLVGQIHKPAIHPALHRHAFHNMNVGDAALSAPRYDFLNLQHLWFPSRAAAIPCHAPCPRIDGCSVFSLHTILSRCPLPSH